MSFVSPVIFQVSALVSVAAVSESLEKDLFFPLFPELLFLFSDSEVSLLD
jgi:hypothetical protein